MKTTAHPDTIMTAKEFVALRRLLGWTLEKTAHECGVNLNTVARWAMGTRTRIPPSSARLLRILAGREAKRLKISA
ncbi:MAG: helix-turn-helix domain-containing protein [Nitrospiraceae bacterium]